jgi:hypothetical protein
MGTATLEHGEFGWGTLGKKHWLGNSRQGYKRLHDPNRSFQFLVLQFPLLQVQQPEFAHPSSLIDSA